MASHLKELLSEGVEELVNSSLGKVCVGLCVKGRLIPCSARDVRRVREGINLSEALGIECVNTSSLSSDELIKDFMGMVAALWIALNEFEGAVLSEFNADPQSLTITFDLQSPDGYGNSVELMGVPGGEGLKWWVVCDEVLINTIKPPKDVKGLVRAAADVIRSVIHGSLT